MWCCADRNAIAPEQAFVNAPARNAVPAGGALDMPQPGAVGFRVFHRLFATVMNKMFRECWVQYSFR
ncbi:hypothetical protein PRIPAC_91570 [Pristionchus pacificus]|uniref:Uncharacterized protein n=1 Tax=Pristionchus pacificus TaxID=54126 RepID=A0A2A6CDQ3_PRIPA|nr:hypothetical protein PRIPAC_91570 [Pristionchus pacificus]|eukprot:PDM76220.1 hypothetical protein PRIPAC_39824 [Pristionchus pacificus]